MASVAPRSLQIVDQVIQPSAQVPRFVAAHAEPDGPSGCGKPDRDFVAYHRVVNNRIRVDRCCPWNVAASVGIHTSQNSKRAITNAM